MVQNGQRRTRVAVILGTRPEAIKLAPVIRELKRRPQSFDCRVVSTGQHRLMVDQAFDAFGLAPDVQLAAMDSAQTLGALTSRLFRDLDTLLQAEPLDWVLVQGDTTSAMAGAVSAYYRRLKVGHVEAGLRTFNRWAPFPEEINRTFIGHVADLHFAPTRRAATNLRMAGVAENRILVTGNTIVDAVHWVQSRLEKGAPQALDHGLLDAINGRRLLVVTSHRRESFGHGLREICAALLALSQRFEDVVIVYPVHLNPNVRGPVYQALATQPRIWLIEPVGYMQMMYLLSQAFLVLTDSGGIQEEVASLRKPTLILRDATERPEVVEAGCARIVGTSMKTIVANAAELLSSPESYEAMTKVENPFGDGTSAIRIVDGIEEHDSGLEATAGGKSV